MRRRSLHRGLAAALALALPLAPLPGLVPVAAAKGRIPAPDPVTKGRATVVAEVRDGQGKPLPGIRFVVVPMDGQGKGGEAKADRRGVAVIEPLGYGYYRYAIVAPDGAYVGNRILLVPPDREVKVEFDLSPFLPEDDRQGLSRTDPAPGTDQPPVGVARLKEDSGPKGLAWFQTGKGVAVIVGAGILLVAAVIALTDPGSSSTSSASPSSPSR